MAIGRKWAVAPPPEADALVGDIGDWEPDLDFRFPARRGMQIVLDLDADDAALVRQTVGGGDGDYVGFTRRAVMDAARAAVARGQDTPALLTLAVAAARFGVQRDRLQRAALAGRLPAQKVGPGRSHPWLVRPEDVERFLRESHRRRKRHAA